MTINPSIRIYVNKIENRITFKIKTGYYVKLLTSETVKLLGITKIKITQKMKMIKKTPYLEIHEVVLVHSNISNKNYSQNLRVLYTFVPN